LHDQGYGTALAAEPTTRWLAFMEAEGTEPVWLLHRSELTGADATSALPRGCALSWTVRYMASFAPAQAEVLWRRYRAHFQVTKGPVTGFREWPPGVEGAADSDSGPIVYGIGSSATAFAIGASRAVGDMETYRRLAATERITWTLAAGMGGALGEAADSALATAIHANQHSLPGPL
jgi:hypothetical protein